MREPPDYESIEQDLWKKNAKSVTERLAASDSNILDKIQTFIWRFDFPIEIVKEKIKNDSLFAAHFAKEPRRTTLHERIAANWLEEEESIQDFKVLPSKGKKAYYITSDGEIRKAVKNPPSKSLDFQWRTGKTNFFASHKYTKQSGGNQDSQFKEMRDLLSKFQGSAEKDTALIVIVDGPYYTTEKMNDLRRFVRDRNPKSYACHIQDVPSILRDYIV